MSTFTKFVWSEKIQGSPAFRGLGIPGGGALDTAFLKPIPSRLLEQTRTQIAFPDFLPAGIEVPDLTEVERLDPFLERPRRVALHLQPGGWCPGIELANVEQWKPVNSDAMRHIRL
jgi:hypothetical protein